MKSRYCSCSARNLLDFGCRCNNQLPRTMPINILISLLGFQTSWEVVQKEMWPIDEKRRNRMRTPTDDESLIELLWDIESYSISLHDDIARELEDKWRSRFKPRIFSDDF